MLTTNYLALGLRGFGGSARAREVYAFARSRCCCCERGVMHGMSLYRSCLPILNNGDFRFTRHR